MSATAPFSSVLIELQLEELPPKALKKLGLAFSQGLFDSLGGAGLLSPGSMLESFATPRRLAARISCVLPRAADALIETKLMPVTVGLDAAGAATPALQKKLAALDAADTPVAQLKRVGEGKAETLVLARMSAGVSIQTAAQAALLQSLAKLPIPKQMSYQLERDCALPGWTSVSFVRPAHGLIALYGAELLELQCLGLQSGRSTRGHRFESSAPSLEVADAQSYERTLLTQGAVIASFEVRRAAIAAALKAAAQACGAGLSAIEDDALLDEVTALVERPNVLTCAFEEAFLSVPQECLILTMKANQKYFPLVDAQGKLSRFFLVVSNISPADPSRVIEGNERVVRPRLADAKFFFEQDLKHGLKARAEGLGRVVYHNKLGSQGERVARVATIAGSIAAKLGDAEFVQQVRNAAELAKADLLSDMVGEFPELQGTMGRYYALAEKLDVPVCDAIEDHYKPRFAGDSLPRGRVGTVLALADKLETLVGLFGVGQVPTGDKDPFALRRQALGVIRLLIEGKLPLGLDELIDVAAQAFGTLLQAPLAPLRDFIDERLANSLKEQGFSAQEIEAVLALRPERLLELTARLEAVRAFAALAEAPALAAANKRVGNILKKADAAHSAALNPSLLVEPAELALHQDLTQIAPRADALFGAGSYTESLATLAALKAPVDAFFEGVMVNAEDAKLRMNRLALLRQLHSAMNRVADLAKLAA